MSDGDARADPPATQGGGSSENGSDAARVLPPSPPTPGTGAGLQFNQLNIQQIPPSALDRLSPDQVLAFYQSTLEHMESADSRRFEFAMAHSKREGTAEKRNVWIGGLLGIAGLVVACVLALRGHEAVAMAVVSFLATIIAVVVGSKLLK